MKLPKAFALFLLIVSGAVCAVAQPAGYEKLKAEAERLYAESSYARAQELYARADASQLAPDEARWVAFRLADTLWRAQSSTETADSTKFERAQAQLEELVRESVRAGKRDRVWAEAEESLGDFWWTRRDAHNWGQSWPHYQNALDWWAGARDIEQARTRYLKIVWRVANPPYVDEYYYYGYYGNTLPLEILENALRVARGAQDQAHAHYLLAMTLRQQGDEEMRGRAEEEFEAALKTGKASDWYDDALYFYAEWLANNGRARMSEGGQWQYEPDYVKALELYRRLLREFAKGETRFYDQAKERVEEIVKPSLSVGVGNVFLPDSEIQFYLNWRNVKRINFTLSPVNLPRDVRFKTDADGESWVQAIKVPAGQRVRTWTKETGDKGAHMPGQEMSRIEGRLPVGAYLLEATGDTGATAREVILVSDAALVLKSSGKRALVYFCNAQTGAPVAGAGVKLWQKLYRNEKWVWRETEGTTNKDGLAVFDVPETQQYTSEIFASAEQDNRQAFSVGSSYGAQASEPAWRIYAFTDRPAYRPHETAQWKFIARRYEAGAYSTPAQQMVEFEIADPRGAKVHEGKAVLNSFGSAWGALELTEAMPLGEYRITFWDAGRQHHIGNATLFRLEEYKLPEFKVSISTPEENGRRKAFRVGEKVEVKIEADYYFGGAVGGGTVEVLVYQSPFYHWWHPSREYAWYYDDDNERVRAYYGGGQIIKRETLKLDAEGRATITFETPRGAGQDFEYRVEARVTDASRREITASDVVRVTRQRYYVYPRAEHNLYRPQDTVKLDIKAIDANNQPVVTEGTIKVTRDYWYEIWIDPQGREVKGEELRQLREKYAVFPPPAQAANGRTGWRLKFRGYEHDDLLTQLVKTDAEGAAEFRFKPEREGYYRIAWSSPDKNNAQIKAETTVWVANNATTELGYRQGGVEIIVDKDTFRAGQTAPVMLTAPTNDRYVLFSVEGEDLYSYQLVHLTGTAKLVELPIEEKHVPNIFLSATLVNDGQISVDTKQVVVPPVRQFLNVELKADREQYQPREEGTLTVTTRDSDGRAVAAEVALALVDQSVFYIQRGYAGDPRQFYYGSKRAQRVQSQSTFQQKAYAKFVEGAGKQLIDERVLRAAEQQAREQDAPFSRLQILADLQRAPNVSSREERSAYKSVSEADEVVRIDGMRNSPVNGRAYGEFAMLKSSVAGAKDTPAPPPGGAPVAQEPTVQVRSDFRSTVFWQPDVNTDAGGRATVKIKYPDSLTGWQATASVASSGNQFGTASASTRTKQPLIVRLQAPRFFVVGDKVTVSAVLNNNTDASMRVAPSLAAEGLKVSGVVVDGRASNVAESSPPVEVKANGETRVDWLVVVEQAGEAKLKVTARGDRYADAMEKTYSVYEHGIEKFVSKSGKMRGGEAVVSLDIPRERRAESTSLTVQVAPSMAVTMLDALPYLIDYPYGCTEQTMSRFLPAAITAKTLKDLGLPPEAVMNKIFGGVEPEHAGATHPKGKRDLRRLAEITKMSLNRLYDFQHADGGWGWWKDGDSDHFMSAYVVWGMTLARDAGIEIKPDVLERAAVYLDKEIVEEETSYDEQAWMLHALAVYHASTKRAEVGGFQQKAFENLWTNRDRLNAYTRALLALCAHNFGYRERALTLVRNLENGAKIDDAPDISVVQEGAQQSHAAVISTAHWGEDGIYYRWSDGGVEATSFALRALLAIDPQNKLIEPVTNWLVKNRRGAQWSNTRDTAITVLTLDEYLRASGELSPDLSYELLVNGHSVTTQRLTAADALNAPSRFEIERGYLRDGANQIQIRRTSGASPVYFSAEAQFFSLEEPVKPAGNEIFVRRQYYKLVSRQTLLKGTVYDRLPLNDGETVESGERVEAVITVEAKNNYEYLVFEDLKPAGLETVRIRSGEPLYARELKSGAVERKFGNADAATTTTINAQARDATLSVSSRMAQALEGDDVYTSRSRWIYQELRDRKVALFLDRLPEGVWEIRYDFRAETPGQFHALPMLGYAMYVPEIRCNGTEIRINVADGK